MRALFAVAMAIVAVAATAAEQEPVTARIDANTTIVATAPKGNDEAAEVRLVRGGQVIWRGRLRERVRGIFARDLVGDARPEVIIEYANMARNPYSGVYRYDGKSLATIGEVSNYWGFLTIDYDGDGREELVDTGCCDNGGCATGIYTGILRYDGERFVSLRKEFVQLVTFTAARGGESFLPERPEGDYIAHLISKGGRACGWIRDNGKNIILVNGQRSNRRVHLDDSCHKLSFSGLMVGSTTLSLLLERIGPEKPKTYPAPQWPTKHDALMTDETRTAH